MENDFIPFQKQAPTLHHGQDFNIAADGPHTVYMLEIRGIAFLWHMVRCIMAVLMLVGEGHEDPTIIDTLFNIEEVPAKPDYHMAAEAPLVLHECGYERLTMEYQPKVLWDLTKHFEQEWEKHILAAARARNSLSFLHSCSVRQRDVRDLEVLLLKKLNNESSVRAKAAEAIGTAVDASKQSNSEILNSVSLSDEALHTPTTTTYSVDLLALASANTNQTDRHGEAVSASVITYTSKHLRNTSKESEQSATGSAVDGDGVNSNSPSSSERKRVKFFQGAEVSSLSSSVASSVSGLVAGVVAGDTNVWASVENYAEDFFENQSENYNVSWSDALVYFAARGYDPLSSMTTHTHVPLLKRGKAATYAQRRLLLSGAKAARLDRHIRLQDSAKTSDPDFFNRMRSQGSMLSATDSSL